MSAKGRAGGEREVRSTKHEGAGVGAQGRGFSDEDRVHMARALELARRGLTTTMPNPRVGCVIARAGKVIGEGFTQPAGEDHAEIQALKDCAARGASPAGATAYVSLEPCSHHGRTPPCVDSLLGAGLARVVAAVGDPNPRVAGEGFRRLRAAGVQVETGLLADEARELNVGFFARMERGRPWVRVKMAATLDGRTALADGRSQWITGGAARRDGHAWRARACAVLTGIGTVLQDDPRLTVRDVGVTRQPVRVIVDRHARTPSAARVFAAGRVWVFAATAPPPDWPAHVETVALADATGKVDLEAMMRELARREVNEVHVEAGARLAGALVAAGLADELLVYLAPSLLGDDARGMFALPPLASLEERIRLRIASVDPVGEDWRVVARFESGGR